MEYILSPEALPPRYRMVSAASCSGIWAEADIDSLNRLLPDWLLNEASPRLMPHLNLRAEFSPFQIFIIDKEDIPESNNCTVDGKIVAVARSVPFYWAAFDSSSTSFDDALQKLPDGGWSDIMTTAMAQCRHRAINCSRKDDSEAKGIYLHPHETILPGDYQMQIPNALCGLEILVRQENRQDNLAEILIQTLKRLARHFDFKALVIPVRPTNKHSFPYVSMDTYVSWGKIPGSFEPVTDNVNLTNGDEPFDPWLRKHVRLGARILKVCNRSYIIRRNAVAWEKESGVNFDQATRSRCPTGTCDIMGDYFEVNIPRALVPVRWYSADDVGIYVEPNVWIYHDLHR